MTGCTSSLKVIPSCGTERGGTGVGIYEVQDKALETSTSAGMAGPSAGALHAQGAT